MGKSTVHDSTIRAEWCQKPHKRNPYSNPHRSSCWLRFLVPSKLCSLCGDALPHRKRSQSLEAEQDPKNRQPPALNPKSLNPEPGLRWGRRTYFRGRVFQGHSSPVMGLGYFLGGGCGGLQDLNLQQSKKTHKTWECHHWRFEAEGTEVCLLLLADRP